MAEWVSALIYQKIGLDSSPHDSRIETSLRSINTGMSLVSFVQGLILEHQSLTI